MKEVNIVVGRFQPFTAGHYKCVETAWNEKGLHTVICIIDTPESKVDRRHPFTSEMLIDLYSDLFNNDNKIEMILPVKNANIVLISNELAKYGLQVGSWTCGTDRYNGYKSMADKYAEAAGLSDDFEVIEVKRSDEDISATKARNCLLNDDIYGFMSLLPNGNFKYKDEIFNDLKEQIEKAYSIPEEPKRTRRRPSATTSIEQRIRNLEYAVLENRISYLESLLLR